MRRHRSIPRLVVVAVLTGAVPVVSSTLSARQESKAAQPTAQTPAQAPIIGRWDLTVQGPKAPYPSWLEVTLSGNRTLVGRFVGSGGSARPISRVEFNSGSLHFAIPSAVGEGDVRSRRRRHAHR